MNKMETSDKLCETCFPRDSYDVVKKLGSGCFGSAFHVRSRYHEEFAVKQYDDQLKPLTRSNACDSVKELDSIENIYCIKMICSLFKEHDDDDNNKIYHRYIFMELCAEKTLNDWIQENKTRESRQEDKMKIWIQQMLLALQYLHKTGIIHRDLKPDNVFFARNPGYGIDGVLKIGDFGMIKRCENLRNSPSNKLKSSSFSIGKNESYGSPHYRAPELDGKKRKRTYNSKVDVFSLGIIAAELLHVYEPSHIEGEVNKTFRKNVENRKISPHLKGLPENAKKFLMDATEPNPDRRPFADELWSHVFLVDVSQSTESVDLQNSIKDRRSTVNRIGILYDGFKDIKRCFSDREPRKKRIECIRAAQLCLTNSCDCECAFDDCSLEDLENYFGDLCYYADRLKNHKITWFRLEEASFEFLKESYTQHHFKVIPAFEIWLMKECREFMRETLSTHPLLFSNHWFAQYIQRHYLFDTVTDHSEQRNNEKNLLYKMNDLMKTRIEDLSMDQREECLKILKTPLPTRGDLVAFRSRTFSNYFLRENIVIPKEYYEESRLIGYLRLVISASRTTVSRRVFDEVSLVNEAEKMSEFEGGILPFPTVELYLKHPLEEWESWFEMTCEYLHAIHYGSTLSFSCLTTIDGNVRNIPEKPGKLLSTFCHTGK